MNLFFCYHGKLAFVKIAVHVFNFVIMLFDLPMIDYPPPPRFGVTNAQERLCPLKENPGCF